MTSVKDLKIKIFLDVAKTEEFKAYSDLEYIKGFTTNPSLMKEARVVDYENFIKEVLPLVKRKPISFEVISDDFEEMERQAIKLSKFGENIYVKIPITNTRSAPSIPVIEDLIHRKVKTNVTAIMTIAQIENLSMVLDKKTPVILSIFAGRIADTGVDPAPIFKQARQLLKGFRNVELLWASPRELLNIFQAQEAGCDMITILPEILAKIHLIGYDLGNFSLDTVKMFYNDAVSSGLKI